MRVKEKLILTYTVKSFIKLQTALTLSKERDVTSIIVSVEHSSPCLYVANYVLLHSCIKCKS